MLELLIVSLLWAFSFGLIKDNLAGLNASFVAFARLGIAFLALAPFMRPNRLPRKQVLQFILIGVVQFGIMYIAYNASFRYLKAFEVALFTIFTPIYVALIDQFFERRVRWVSVAAAVLAVIGTGVVSWAGLQSRDLATGFLVVQISNIAFALGQLAYRRVARDLPGDTKDIQTISLLYLGGAALTLGSTLISGGFNQVALAPRQAWILVYLGVIASGLGFYGWNRGARRVNAGSLAVFNDLKVPLAVVVSLVVFGERADLLHLFVGAGIVLLALLVNEGILRGKKPAQDHALDPERVSDPSAKNPVVKIPD